MILPLNSVDKVNGEVGQSRVQIPKFVRKIVYSACSNILWCFSLNQMYSLRLWTPGCLDSGRLDSRHLDSGRLDAWTLGLCTTERLDTGCLDSRTGRLYSGRLDSRRLDSGLLDPENFIHF